MTGWRGTGVAAHYVLYFNKVRPHQGIAQRIPDGPTNDNRKAA